MDQEQRRRTDPRSSVPQDPEPGDNDTASLRADSDALLAAADAAIERALSRNSDEFLEQNRQRGGQ